MYKVELKLVCRRINSEEFDELSRKLAAYDESFLQRYNRNKPGGDVGRHADKQSEFSLVLRSSRVDEFLRAATGDTDVHYVTSRLKNPPGGLALAAKVMLLSNAVRNPIAPKTGLELEEYQIP